MTDHDHTALYVYALVPDRPGAADGITGLDGRPLRLAGVPGTGVAALVHDAAPAPYEGGDAEVRRWVAEQSEAVTAVWERTGSVLPMTFNVLVADDTASGLDARQRLAAWVAEQEPGVSEQLAALEGRCELRVEITVDRAAAADGSAPPSDTPPSDTPSSASPPSGTPGRDAPLERPGDGAVSPGMRRLLAKQREREARDAAGRLADVLHAEVRQRLLAVAEDIRDRGPVHRSADETDVLSAALLVRNEDIDAVGTVLGDLGAREPAVRIRFFGPWPPYSFTDDRHRAYAERPAS